MCTFRTDTNVTIFIWSTLCTNWDTHTIQQHLLACQLTGGSFWALESSDYLSFPLITCRFLWGEMVFTYFSTMFFMQSCWSSLEVWKQVTLCSIKLKEGNVLFNDALNTFYFYGCMVSDMGYSFQLAARDLLCTIPQTGEHWNIPWQFVVWVLLYSTDTILCKKEAKAR